MTYYVDQRDIEFNLFEYLNISELTRFPIFSEQSADMYQMVLQEALKFAQKELDPLNVVGDRNECHIENRKVKAPKGFKEAYQAYAQNGFIGMDVPVSHGGQGLPVILAVTSGEYFLGANIAFTMYPGLTRGGAHVIDTFAPKEIAELFCPKMYSGQWGGTMCLTEPQAGTAVGDLKTSAKLNTDGTYSIRGNKIFISSGDHDLTENIIHLVLARIEGDPVGTKGISLFAIPKIWVNSDGSLAESNDVSCVNVEHKMGIKGSATCSLNFGEKGKCRGFLVGEQAKGMNHMFQLMNEARLMVGMQGLALAGASYEHAVRYAKERIQGGNEAIIHYPDVRRNLSLCKALVEGMRGLLYSASKQADVARYHPDAAQREKAQNRLELLTPICKAYCSDFGFRVTEWALQVYGGYGYISEYPMEQYLRDAKISSIYEGTNGVQALDLLARKLPRKNGQLFREFYEDLNQLTDSLVSHPRLKNEGEALKIAVDTVGEVAMKLAEWGMNGDKISPQLGATLFLEICGHVALASILLEQACLAHEKIQQGSKELFYQNKIRTAQFFVSEFLPLVRARAKTIMNENNKAMEMEF